MIPGWERFPGEGNGNPLQYSGLENPMDRGVHGVAESRTQLSDFTFTIKIMDPVIEICIGTLYRMEYSVLSWKSWGWGVALGGLQLILKIDMVAVSIAVRAKDEGPSRG